MVKWLRIPIFGLLLVLVAACNEAPVAPGSEECKTNLADIKREMTSDSTWIVFFKPGAVSDVRAEAEKIAQRYNGEVRLVFESLEGFSAKLPPVAVQALCRSPKVDLVAPNGWVGRASQQALIDAVEPSGRIDQQALLLDRPTTTPGMGPAEAWIPVPH